MPGNFCRNLVKTLRARGERRRPPSEGCNWPKVRESQSHQILNLQRAMIQSSNVVLTSCISLLRTQQEVHFVGCFTSRSTADYDARMLNAMSLLPLVETRIKLFVKLTSI